MPARYWAVMDIAFRVMLQHWRASLQLHSLPAPPSSASLAVEARLLSSLFPRSKVRMRACQRTSQWVPPQLLMLPGKGTLQGRNRKSRLPCYRDDFLSGLSLHLQHRQCQVFPSVSLRFSIVMNQPSTIDGLMRISLCLGSWCMTHKLHDVLSQIPYGTSAFFMLLEKNLRFSLIYNRGSNRSNLELLNMFIQHWIRQLSPSRLLQYRCILTVSKRDYCKLHYVIQYHHFSI